MINQVLTILIALCAIFISLFAAGSRQVLKPLGRKRTRPDTARRVQVAWLLPEQIEYLRAVGQGDLSRGIRLLIDRTIVTDRAKSSADDTAGMTNGSRRVGSPALPARTPAPLCNDTLGNSAAMLYPQPDPPAAPDTRGRAGRPG